MNIAVMFALILLAIAVWWLLLQQLQTKPWLEPGLAPESVSSVRNYSPKVIGLGVFLAVVTALFSLFATAYHMRMNVPDWSHLPLPKLLWVNTALLACGSVAMQWASLASDRYRKDLARNSALDLHTVRQGLLLGGGFAVAFLAGQILAWRQLDAIGFFFACSPASAFFYVLTGLHGAHLCGGLVVWGKTTSAVWQSNFMRSAESASATLLNVKLCAVYWHYLLLIWLALFALFALT